MYNQHWLDVTSVIPRQRGATRSLDRDMPQGNPDESNLSQRVLLHAPKRPVGSALYDFDLEALRQNGQCRAAATHGWRQIQIARVVKFLIMAEPALLGR